MEKEPDKAKARTEENKPTKLKAENNPWYLLATLYAVPDREGYSLRNDDLLLKNRVAWNRYFAAGLDEEMRARLKDEGRFPAEELEPDVSGANEAFIRRCNSAGKTFDIPDSKSAIDFSNIQFDQEIYFYRYMFINASFSDTIFMRKAGFYDATFVGNTNFMDAIFAEDARFSRTKFYNKGFFNRARFLGIADFNSADCKWTEFEEAIFDDYANFSDARFAGSSFFNRAEMKCRTDFTNVQFGAPPICYDAKFYEGTNWRGIEWPTPPEGGAVAEAFVDAYACLKREMERLKKHDDELIFFAYELKSRRIELGPVKGLPIAIYGTVSDCGRSYVRPLCGLLLAIVAMAQAFLYFGILPVDEAYGFSIANTLNVFDFRKEFFDSSFINCLPHWVKVFAALQTILGAIFLFLFGLGIRNRFRMK